MPLIQMEMIDKVKALALKDDDVDAVLMYGSFIKGEGDEFSDIEFYLFCNKEVDSKAWVSQVRPPLIFFKNEFGTEVAIFDNLVRGEFHFDLVDNIGIVKSWEGLTSFEHAGQMVLADKSGRLEKVLSTISKERPQHQSQDAIDWLAESLLNNLLMVRNVLKRGEAAHAQQGFQFIQKYLIWLIRLADKAEAHWESPTKKLESEISSSRYEVYAACVPDISDESLNKSLKAALALADNLFIELKAARPIIDTLARVRLMDEND